MPVVPIDFVLFGLTLLGVAILHHRTLEVAVSGLTVITLYKLIFDEFGEGPGAPGLVAHLRHEWVVLANLAGLLLGFALLSCHFEHSGVPKALPRLLPTGWKGAFAMLSVVFVLSSFLDNIAAALIGATMAHALFPSVRVGYLAGIVAAANAGGAGSVVGDTTTTMMWISHVAPVDVFRAYVAAVTAFVVSGVPAALGQDRHSPMTRRDAAHSIAIDWPRVAIVITMLAAAVVVNVAVNTRFPAWSDAFPFLGAAVWIVLLCSSPIRRPDWMAFRAALRGTVFLLSLVLSASMMPVERLPPVSWLTTLALGFISAVFDNIPLTALALEQGGYDWGMLAYAVGFGGSMIWFGSSAGVAVSNVFPQARSVWTWLREGWHVALAYVVGFFVMLALLGWHPTPKQVVSAPARSLGLAVSR